MRITTMTCLIFCLVAQSGIAQVGGNVGFGQNGGRARADQNERSKRLLSKEDMPPNEKCQFIDASVLMNVKADTFVAVFGLAEQAQTVEGCHEKIQATVSAFTDLLKPIGVGPEAIFVDFTAQSKIYAFKVEGNLAKEHVEGFELKKTFAIRYHDKALIDRLIVAASKAKIFDLIKVDYIVTDPVPVQAHLAETAAAVIKSKVARQERLLGVKLHAIPQVYAERFSTYFPTEMYDSYTAAESETVMSGIDRSRTTIQALRKSRTFYYNPLDADGFDRVIEPIVLEPVVQFTLYLKVKYDMAAKP